MRDLYPFHHSAWLNAAMSLRPRGRRALVPGSHRGRSATVATVAALALIPAAPGLAFAADPGPTGEVTSSRREAVILRGAPSTAPELARAVTAVGGTVTRNLPIIDGLA